MAAISNQNTTKDSSLNKVEIKDTTLTRENITALGNLIRMCDSDLESKLDLFCYNKCDNDSNSLIKKCRGVVFNQNQIVIKGMPYTEEYTSENVEKLGKQLGEDLTQYHIYDAYEGCLLRLFNFNNKWFLSTHKKINAFRSKWSSKDSFGLMFQNALQYEYNVENSVLKERLGECEEKEVYNTFLSKLDTDKQYMFLICNTFDNRIVCQPSQNPQVYHVATYLDNGKNISFKEEVGLKYPMKHDFTNMDQLKDYVKHVDFKEKQGVIIFDDNNKQWKLFNDEYHELFLICGNEPSIKYRYLQVRMNMEDTNKLYYLYPKFADIFDDYENTLYDLAKRINVNYINRFIKKKFITVSKEEYIIMQACHKWHMENREKNRISLRKVIDIMNLQSSTHLNKMIRNYKLEKLNVNKDKKEKRPRARSNLKEKDTPKDVKKDLEKLNLNEDNSQ